MHTVDIHILYSVDVCSRFTLLSETKSTVLECPYTVEQRSNSDSGQIPCLRNNVLEASSVSNPQTLRQYPIDYIVEIEVLTDVNHH